MSASDGAEVEAVLVRLGELRGTLSTIGKARNASAEGTGEDLLTAEQALAQAERLLRRAKPHLDGA